MIDCWCLSASCAEHPIDGCTCLPQRISAKSRAAVLRPSVLWRENGTDP